MKFRFAGLLGFGLLLLSLAPAAAQLFETKAAQAFMIDAETGTVLFSKDADRPIPPASLAKLMTMEVAFNAVKSRRMTLDDTFVVSENAWRTGGAPSRTSTMFAKLKSAIRLEDLIQGVTVQAANDGCIIIAEGLAGSEANFAAQMTERARQIGLEKSTFVNSTGLPADGQQTTVRELALLALHIWREYPDLYRYYGQKDFTWNKITQKNRNPLLAMDIGADGLAVGMSEASGFGIVGSVSHNGARLIAAMSGLASDRERAEEARKLLDWGIRSFQKTEIFARNEVVGEAQVFGGAKSGVALRAKGPVNIFVPIANRDS
jgi:D-alanyl-D-alanine carboxypeptidase (penicillin-binding protein 5/6)